MISLFRYFFTFSSAVIFIYGILTAEYPLCLSGIILLLIANVLYTVQYWKDFLVVFLFIFTFTLFLVGRPIIRYLNNDVNWITYIPNLDNFVFTIIYVGLLSIYLGMACYRFFDLRKLTQSNNGPKKSRISLLYQSKLVKVSMVIFGLGWICEMALGIEKIVFMADREYTDFFKLYEEMAPLPIRTLATFMPYAMCVYLATKPCKKNSVVVLLMYISTQIPTLLIGLRGRIMFAVLFAVVYFLIRNIDDKKERWLGRFEKISLIAGIPLVVVGLNIINYTRSGIANLNTGVLSEFYDFIDKQGVSYFTLGRGYYTYSHIPDGFHSYTFGPLLDYILYGPISQLIFGTTPLPSHNSVDLATRGNSFAHLLSYVTHPNYLNGEGYGSSYLLELFADFGWYGVLIGGIAVVYYISAIPRVVNQGNIFLGAFMLYTLTGLLWLPRSSFIGWLDFIVTPQLWLFVVILILATNSLYQSEKACKNASNSSERD